MLPTFPFGPGLGLPVPKRRFAPLLLVVSQSMSTWRISAFDLITCSAASSSSCTNESRRYSSSHPLNNRVSNHLGDVPRIFIVRGSYVGVSSVLQQELEHFARIVEDGDAYARPTLQISGVDVGSEYLRLCAQLVAMIG